MVEEIVLENAAHCNGEGEWNENAGSLLVMSSVWGMATPVITYWCFSQSW